MSIMQYKVSVEGKEREKFIEMPQEIENPALDQSNLRNTRRTGLKNQTGGSVVEYALLLGFSIFIFLVIVGLIISIVNWVDGELLNFFNAL